MPLVSLYSDDGVNRRGEIIAAERWENALPDIWWREMTERLIRRIDIIKRRAVISVSFDEPLKNINRSLNILKLPSSIEQELISRELRRNLGN
jgi:hypothetical protein